MRPRDLSTGAWEQGPLSDSPPWTAPAGPCPPPTGAQVGLLLSLRLPVFLSSSVEQELGAPTPGNPSELPGRKAQGRPRSATQSGLQLAVPALTLAGCRVPTGAMEVDAAPPRARGAVAPFSFQDLHPYLGKLFSSEQLFLDGFFSVSLPAGGSAICVSRRCGSRGGREVAHLSYSGALRPDIEGEGGSCSNLHTPPALPGRDLGRHLLAPAGPRAA